MLVTAVQHQQEQLNRMLRAEDASNPLNAVQMRTAKAMLEAEDRHGSRSRTCRTATRASHAPCRPASPI